MPNLHCGKCGTAARDEDRFCRVCGSPLDPAISVEKRIQSIKPNQGDDGSNERGVISIKLPTSNRTSCLIASGLLFSTITLVTILFILLASQSNDRPFFTVEVVGTPTPYPTRKPYATAAPYKAATPYPTAIPYPTTGPLSTVAPIRDPLEPQYYVAPSFGGCEISVKNQNLYLDSVVILSRIETNDIVAAVYIRASDSFSKSGIRAGTYQTYVTTGQDWDAGTGRFINNADYFRFEEPVVFETCSFSFGFGDYQYVEIILNVIDGSGSDTVGVPPDSFPSLSP